jgi:uncharacterized repeat protein (TIGR03803 family)
MTNMQGNRVSGDLRSLNYLNVNKITRWKMGAFLSLLCIASTVPAAPAQTLAVLYDFCSVGNCADGAQPHAGLVQASDGNLYGTTSGFSSFGSGGTVFTISPFGIVTTLYDFCAQTGCVDGAAPVATLLQGPDQNFYGTTSEAGLYGGGTVFRITSGGSLTTLYSFCAQPSCADGQAPVASLIQGADGNLYGTTNRGGTSAECLNGCGTVFKMTPQGKLTTLYSFCSQSNCTDGSEPYAALTQGTDGNFYGTTAQGGAVGNGPCGGFVGCGTIFKMTPTGVLTTLYSFCAQTGCADGGNPQAPLTLASDGNFYGVAYQGGTHNAGTIFKVTPDGALTTLYSLGSQNGDGGAPLTELIQANDGNLYGTTHWGGATGGGTIFKTTTSGGFTTIYTFCLVVGCLDGDRPYASLAQDTDGTFYGTAEFGGSSNNGTLFNLSVDLGPFIKTQPNFGRVGDSIIILWTGQRGVSAVTFNGTPASFAVESRSEIKATVPAGATTGPVRVVTSGGSLTSIVNFWVVH